MRCSQCDDNPEVVIADSVSISLPSYQRMETLRSPTVHDKAHAWVRLHEIATKLTGFTGPKPLGRTIYDALNQSNIEERLTKRRSEIEKLESFCMSSKGSPPMRFRELDTRIIHHISIASRNIVHL